MHGYATRSQILFLERTYHILLGNWDLLKFCDFECVDRKLIQRDWCQYELELAKSSKV